MKHMRVVWVVLLSMGLGGCGSQQFKESLRVSIATVEAQVLEAAPETSAVRVGVSIAGEFGDPCVELRSVRQIREGDTFKLTLEAVERVDVFCPPVGEFFREFVLLEAQSLPPGSYQVEVGALDPVSGSFNLQEGATYGETDVAKVEVVPTASFEANVIARGELVGC